MWPKEIPIGEMQVNTELENKCRDRACSSNAAKKKFW